MLAQPSEKEESYRVYSHIYNKGHDLKVLFRDNKDYEVFIGFLKEYLSPQANPAQLKETFSVNGRTFKGIPHQPKNYFDKVELLAYSLKPDHFHLILCELKSESLEGLTRSLSTRYAIYYNKKYNHSGSLFTGPYKSVQIKKPSELLYLTRFLHRESLQGNGYSSYTYYLENKQSTWVKQGIALSYFNQFTKNYLKGIKNYKQFIEKTETDSNENTILPNLILETKPKASKAKSSILEPTEYKPEVEYQPVSTPQTKFKVVSFITVFAFIFMLLTTAGAFNIRNYETKTGKYLTLFLSRTPQVAGTNTVEPKNSTPSPSPTLQVTLEPKPQFEITIIDGYKNVNIRKEPSTSTEIVGSASDGDIFNVISYDSGWYHVELDNGTGFIYGNYTETVQGGTGR